VLPFAAPPRDELLSFNLSGEIFGSALAGPESCTKVQIVVAKIRITLGVPGRITFAVPEWITFAVPIGIRYAVLLHSLRSAARFAK